MHFNSNDFVAVGAIVLGLGLVAVSISYMYNDYVQLHTAHAGTHPRKSVFNWEKRGGYSAGSIPLSDIKPPTRTPKASFSRTPAAPVTNNVDNEHTTDLIETTLPAVEVEETKSRRKWPLVATGIALGAGISAYLVTGLLYEE